MEVICLDSSVLIEYYRKGNKKESFLFDLAGRYEFKIPAIVKYEIYKGDKNNDPFWGSIFGGIEILPFDDRSSIIAAQIYLDLRKRNQMIPTDDILIAATAVRNQLKLATSNEKDFKRISSLQVITPGTAR